MKGRVIEQILFQREIEIERARLEHDAEQPQRLARCAADVVSENADASALDSEQAGDEGEQRTLAGAVEAEQRREARRRDRETDIDQGAPRTIGMVDALDGQCGHAARVLPGRALGADAAGGYRIDRCHGCIVMPQGSSPTWMVLITFCATTSITETSLDTPLVTSKYFSSGVKAMCQTRCPTRRYFVTLRLVASTMATRLAGPSATKAVLPSLVMPMPTGWIASRRRPGISKLILPVTTCLTGSMIDTEPPISDDTHNSEPSGLNSAKRGLASTSTLPTILRV